MINIKNISLRIRIFLAMILLLIMAFILIMSVTIYQYDEQSKDYNLQRFGRKEEAAIENIEIEIENNSSVDITPDVLPILFQEKIFEISSIHNLDITFYDLKGRQLVTSKASFFRDSVVQPLPNNIITALADKVDHHIIKTQEKNNISYETSYGYINDLMSKPIGVIKLEFRQDNTDQDLELEEFLSRLTVVYFFMFLIAITLAYFLSSYITRSINAITSKMHQTRLNKRNEKILIENTSSELNVLVEAYNNMIDELEESAVKLAQSEREQAWREMARQVAHEIKNPLTPMRLTVQSFERKFNPEDPKIKEKVKEYSQTLIQQIDVMTSIASAFSDFAKMPKQKKEEIEVIGVVKMALDIFNEKFITYAPEEDQLYAYLDKTQLIRIVTNLITNSTQATKDKEQPEIIVRVYETTNNIIIEVSDNGKGIEEDVKPLIFEPKFSTKSSGMGLGLPMIKKIIEAYGGSISFVSEPEKGTVFTVILPKN